MLCLVISVRSDSEVKTVATVRFKGKIRIIEVDAFELYTE